MSPPDAFNQVLMRAEVRGDHAHPEGAGTWDHLLLHAAEFSWPGEGPPTLPEGLPLRLPRGLVPPPPREGAGSPRDPRGSGARSAATQGRAGLHADAVARFATVPPKPRPEAADHLLQTQSQRQLGGRAS